MDFLLWVRVFYGTRGFDGPSVRYVGGLDEFMTAKPGQILCDAVGFRFRRRACRGVWFFVFHGLSRINERKISIFSTSKVRMGQKYVYGQKFNFRL
jgi:hypothetical protein